MNMKKILLLCYLILVVAFAESASAGSQIDTSNIYIMAYYKAAPEIVLSTAIQEFDKVTESTGQYVEGEIEIWHNSHPDGRNKGDALDMEIRDNTVTNIQFTTTVKVRVRSDGWIVAWLANDQNPNDMIFWDYVKSDAYSPPDTTLGKAIWRITDQLNINYNKNDVKYYSYKYPNADRLKIGGSKIHDLYGTYYFLIPSTITLYEANILWTSYMHDGNTLTIVNETIKIDSESIFNKNTTASYIGTYDLAKYYYAIRQDISRDIRHEIFIRASYTGNQGHASIKSAVMLLYKSG